MTRRAITFLCLACLSLLTEAQESFRVELGRDGETIADMRPVFLKFESRPLPAISPAEVARRYQRLFARSDEPEVRIDALNRLSNIRDRSGQEVGFSPAEEAGVYREVIDSYESILARGSFSGRLDELLYQMAKAHALTGQSEQSVDRLEQLVGLYPRSELVPEARFRIAESAFAAGEYAKAEQTYRALIDAGNSGGLATKARYMLGWSQFKQGQSAWERAGETFLTVLDEFLPTPESVAHVAQANVDTIDDTFRVLALMAARKQGADTLMAWLGHASARHWEYLLFDRLADYYATRGDFEASVAVNQRFVRYAPEHPETPAFMAQVVDVWQRAGEPRQIRAAKADYVAMFGSGSAYGALSSPHQQRWQGFSRQLADFHYDQASKAAGKGERRVAWKGFSLAAEYYEALSGRTGSQGEVWRLAGDARLQAGDYRQALVDYRNAAYDVAHYPEAGDAGWAAVVLLRKGLEGVHGEGFQPGLGDLSEEANRFASQFPEDDRLPGLMVDLASRWLVAGDHGRALDYSQKAVVNPRVSDAESHVGWVVTARVRQNRGEFGLAERAWNRVLALAESGKGQVRASHSPEDVRRQLATVIYRQGEQAAKAGKVSEAVGHFQRVESVLPGSGIAIKGRFDAANTLLKASRLSPAITELGRFRQDFPGHPLAAEISEKLVHAYVADGQPVSAADELLAAAAAGAEPWPARLRAAALLHQAGETERRNQLYLDYLETRPPAGSAEQHVRLQTMRYRLIETTTAPVPWHEALVEHELASEWHSPETLAWAARSSLILGARAAAQFTGVRLAQPLAASLDRKQQALELARQRFLDAETLGGESVRSEALYRRAELYRVLAGDLMTSSVPEDLNELESMQYQMLLEEEAFPFEEKAIRLHSENHNRIATQGYDAWIGKSLGVLSELNPGRYARSVRWMGWAEEEPDDAS